LPDCKTKTIPQRQSFAATPANGRPLGVDLGDWFDD
jgi:hypothetical protein